MAITYHAGRRIQGLSLTTGSEVGETSGSDETRTLGVTASRYRGGIKIATGSALIGQTLSPTKGIKFELKRTGLSGVHTASRFEIWNDTTIISSATVTFQPDTKVGTSYAYVEFFPDSTVTLQANDRITIATDGGVTNYYTFKSNASGSYDTTKTHWTESTWNAGSGGTWTDDTGRDGNFKFTLADVGDVKPTNVQVGSRYEETDTRKMYNYTAPQAATDDIFSTGTGWSGDTSTYPYNSTINGIGCDTSTLGEAVTKTVTTLSASGQWVLRFKVTRETGDLGDGLMINLGSSSASTSSLARMQDGNGLYPYGIHLIYFSNGNTLNAGGSHNTSFAWDSSSTTSVTWSVGDSRWIEVSHPSSSAFTTKVYSNANFTGTADLTNVASTSGQTLNYDDITIGTKWTANRKHIDFEDMQIWNGVTTAPASNNTWEEIGT